MPEKCFFCELANGRAKARILHEDEYCIAVLDKHPANPGHILIIPKEHYQVLQQFPDKTIHHLFTTAREMSKSLLKALSTDGSTILVASGEAAGQTAAHVLIHVIPRREDDDLNLTPPVNTFSPEVLQDAGLKIRTEIEKLL